MEIFPLLLPSCKISKVRLVDLTWASPLAQVDLATTGFSSSIYLSFSLEMRKVVMAADQEREFLEPDSFAEVMEELLRSSAIDW